MSVRGLQNRKDRQQSAEHEQPAVVDHVPLGDPPNLYIQFNQKSSQTEENGGKSKDLVYSHSLPEPEDPETEEGQQVQGKETSDHLVDKHVA